MVFDPSASAATERVHYLNNLLDLMQRVLKRLETGRGCLGANLRPDQQSVTLELIENGRSVEDVAKVFHVKAEAV